MAKLGSDPTSGGTVEEQTQAEDDTSDDQSTTELKPDADGDPMREQTEPVDQSTGSNSSPSGGHAKAPESGTSSPAEQEAETTTPTSDASAPSPDTGGHAVAPEAPSESDPTSSDQQDEPTEPSGDASAPSPDTGGPAKAPEAPPESEPTTDSGTNESSEQRPDVRREQSNTPTSGGVAGPPGSGVTVEEETRDEIDAVKQRVAAQNENLDADDIRVTGDRDGRVSFEVTEEARQEQFNDLTEGREGAVRAVDEQYQRQIDFADYQPAGRSTPGGNLVPGPTTGAGSRASDPGAPRAALRGGEVLAAVRDAESAEFSFDVGGHTIAIGGQRGEFEAVRGPDGEIQIRQVDQFDSQTNPDSPYAQGALTFGIPTKTIERGLDTAISGGREVADTAGTLFTASVANYYATRPSTPGAQPRSTTSPFVEQAAEEVRTEETDTGATDIDDILLQSGEVAKEESGGYRAVAGAASEVAAIPTYPLSIARASIEGGELAASSVEAANAGTTREFSSDVGERASGAVASSATAATERPYETAGRAVGSLVGTGAVIGGAARVSSRAGTAARYAIQPGEEVLGQVGYRATRAATSERRAEQFFPNKEPVLFSEEAAIRAGQRGAAAARRTGQRLRAGEFVSESRGQARLTGPRSRTEVEVEEDTDDLGVPDDDPFRVSDKRLYDPAREFGDADDPSRFIDETRRGSPQSQQDIGSGIAGRGDPQTATGELSFEENFNRAIRRKQEAATRPEARVSDTELGTRGLETTLAGTQPAVSDLGLESEVLQSPAERLDQRKQTQTDTGLETDVVFETAFESDTRREFETAQETESGFEFESEATQEFGLELEFEAETESETEVETDILQDNPRRRRGVSDIFEGERRTQTRRLIDPLTGR